MHIDWKGISTAVIAGAILSYASSHFLIYNRVTKLEVEVENLKVAYHKNKKPSIWISLNRVERIEGLLIQLKDIRKFNEICVDIKINLPGEEPIKLRCLRKGEGKRFRYANSLYTISLIEVKNSEANIEIRRIVN